MATDDRACTLEGCSHTFGHYHRDTLDGEEIVWTERERGSPCPKCGKAWINGDCTTTVSRRALCARRATESGCVESIPARPGGTQRQGTTATNASGHSDGGAG